MKSRIIALIIGCAVAVGVSAETLHSSYFLERMPYRYRLNPALINDYGYLSFPVLGDISFGVNSNLSLSRFLFPQGDGLVTGLHPSISSDKFLGGLKKKNTLGMDFDLTLLSFGFFAFNGYNTFDLSFKSSTSMYLPKDIFTFLKTGQGKTGAAEYNFGNIALQSNNYAELALGHARHWNDRLDVGARLKFLIGGANIDARIDKMNLSLSDEAWRIRSHGYANVSVAGLSLKQNAKGEISGFDLDSPGLGGFGMGVDLGATYRLLDNLTLSMAVTDLGFIHWSQNVRGETPDGAFDFEGFQHLGAKDDDEGNNAFDDELDQIKDDLSALMKFRQVDASSRSTMLRTTLNIGAEYGVLNNKISFGLLWSTRFSSIKTRTELMATANFRPAKCFMATLNGSVSNTGCSWGALLNLCPKGFNFFVGTDYTITKLSPQFIPVKRPNLSVSLGINFLFGSDPRLKNRTVYNPVPAY
ncbi:MAG: hypothetical protein J1E02_00220 [Coprobacter sp.]|nr:hypothetical protein [Coprobacter sp.]